MVLCLLVVLELKLPLAPKSDGTRRPLLISLGVRWRSVLGFAKGTWMHSQVRHCKNISFVSMIQCMDEIWHTVSKQITVSQIKKYGMTPFSCIVEKQN